MEIRDIQKITEMMELLESKQELQTKLAKIDKKIDSKQQNCAHNIVIDLGGFFLNHQKINGITKAGPCRCLFCGADDIWQQTNIIVDANRYLSRYNASEEKDRNEKFKMLQIIALGLMKQKTNISNEEIINELNKIIKEHVELEEQLRIEVQPQKYLK